MIFASSSQSAVALMVVLVVELRPFPVDGSIISSVGYIFEAFSPYAMVQFFEFSDKGWNISENCLRNMYTYLRGLRKGATWAIKLYDATGYYAGSAFGESKLRIENTRLCRDLLLKYKEQKERNYLVNIPRLNSTVVPFPVQLISGQYLLEFAGDHQNKYRKIQQLICFPQSCNDLDLEQILAVTLFQSNQVVESNTYLRHRIVYGNYSPFKDPNFYLLIALFSVALFVYTTAYLLQVYFEFRNRRNNSLEVDAECREGCIERRRRSPLTANIESLFAKKFQIKIIDMNWSMSATGENLPKIVTGTQRTRQFEDFISQISIYNVVYDLFRSEEDLPQLKLRFIFTILLVYAHLGAETIFMANNKGSSDNSFLRQSSFLFDGLLVLSASKLAFGYLQGSPPEKLNVSANLKYIAKLVIGKILRYAPSYMCCLFTAQMLDRYFLFNVALEIPSLDYKNCGLNNILSTVFYWDIFFPLTERCMPWAWFMSLEVQFFMVACLVLLLTKIQPQFASVIGIGFFIISILGAILWHTGEKNRLDFGNSTIPITAELAEFNLISDNIFLSIPPYLIGLYLGYILHNTATNINLNVFILIIGYTGCLFIWTFFHFGLEIVFSMESNLLNIIFTVLGHTVWSLAIMWIILTSFSCSEGILSKYLCFRYATVLETLSPICLLIAPIVIRFLEFTADAPIYTSNLRLFPQVVGSVLVTFAFSFFFYVIGDGLIYTIFKALAKYK